MTASRSACRASRLAAPALLACLLACGRPDGTAPGGDADRSSAGASGTGAADRSGEAGGRGRIVVFGIDGADWQVIEPLAARGRLPAFKRLIEEGATGTLLSQEPSASPSLWTTIATGVGPARHGIHGFVVGDGAGAAAHDDDPRAPRADGQAAVRPVTSGMRRAPAFWNILPRYGRKVGVVGWLVTWPAEPTNGYIVSSYLPYIYNWSTGRPLKGTIVKGIPRQTFPEALIDELEADKVKPAGLEGDLIGRFYDPIAVSGLPRDDQECVLGFLWSLACDETYRRIGERLYREYPVDLFAIYFGGVDVASHRFWKFAHPDALPYGVTPARAGVLGGVIDAYYVYLDGLLGEYMNRLGTDGTLVVLSDHGFKPVLFPGKPTTSGHHRLQGIIGFYGRGVKRGGRIASAGLVDVLPTLLRLLDVPIAQDLEGRVIADALDAGFLGSRPAASVATYGPLDRPAEPGESELDRNVLERLRSLGYIN
jgi:predicted AlkP superfamily phosphohydrolase/phosphomutase